MQTFRLREGQDFSTAEYSSQAWTDTAGSTRPNVVMLVNPSGAQTPSTSFVGTPAFRCVAAPKAASPSDAWEAVARSDLRNAGSAATLCAAGNNEGSYADCGTISQLEANGYQHASNVTLVITTATATRWVAQAQHDSGGSAYRFDTDTGQIVPIPRF